LACHLEIDADPDPASNFDADADLDPDPAYHLDADADLDPDPAYHFDADADLDTDPTYHFDADARLHGRTIFFRRGKQRSPPKNSDPSVHSPQYIEHKKPLQRFST
jgi:hypothetical protein